MTATEIKSLAVSYDNKINEIQELIDRIEKQIRYSNEVNPGAFDMLFGQAADAYKYKIEVMVAKTIMLSKENLIPSPFIKAMGIDSDKTVCSIENYCEIKPNEPQTQKTKE